PNRRLVAAAKRHIVVILEHCPKSPACVFVSSWPGVSRPSCRSIPRSRPDQVQGRRGFRSSNLWLLEVNLGADLLQGGLDLLRLVLGVASLAGRGRAFDQILGFLEAGAGAPPPLLNPLDLLAADRREHAREFGLLLDRSRRGPRGWTRRHRDGCRRRDAP